MIIYKATNTITGKSYIGQTVKRLETRIWGHQTSANKGSMTHFHNSIRKNGMDVFEWEILCEVNTKEQLDENEKFYIKLYGDYNLTKGGDGVQLFGKDNGMYGKKRPEMMGDNNPAKRPEVRKKISEANRGREHPELIEYNKQQAGKSFEHRFGEDKARQIKQKMSEKATGRVHPPRSDETRAKIAKSKEVYTYEMISPKGDILVITNLKQFAIEQGLDKGSLQNLVHGRTKKGVHKEWRGRILNETDR